MKKNVLQSAKIRILWVIVIIQMLLFIYKCKWEIYITNAMSCNSFNAIYVLICSALLKEYIRETGVGNARLRDRVTVHR